MSEMKADEPTTLGRGGVEPQWRLESLQMVNWGGFDGHHRVDYHPESTLVSGGSGTGKSTMLDAYTALVMPWKVPFNGASNDSGSGRARDEAGGQRTLLTYLRGKVGNTGGGNKSASLLRGKGRPTWGAVGGTFVNTDGTAFTAARVYYVPATATDVSGIQTHMLTFDGRLNLGDLSDPMRTFVPSSQKLGRVLVSAVPGIRRHETYDKFSSALFSKLAIGRDADGDHALELLARIQASKSFPSVNELYRQLVLDEPITFADADRAIGDFDKLEEMYQKMESDADKAQTLKDIPAIYERLGSAQKEARELDTFGLRRPGTNTPVYVWTKQTESRLVESAISALLVEKKQTVLDHGKAVERAGQLKEQLGIARLEYDQHGGADLMTLDAQIQTAEAARDAKESTLARLLSQTQPLALDLSTREALDTAQAAAAQYLAVEEETLAAEREKQREAIIRQGKLRERHDEIGDELKSLENRDGRIPKKLDDLRRAVAGASGIAVMELPFLAELIDIADGEGRWRLAVETVLGGDARRLLVPAERFEQFSSSIDRLQLRGRITFAAAESDKSLKFDLSGAGDPEQSQRLAGKVQYADHPFTGWIQRRLSAPSRNALCVKDADGLSGDGFRVTLAGQTRNGTEGAHGRTSSEYVIGFNNASLVDELGVELAQIRETLDAVDKELGQLVYEARQRRNVRDAHKALESYTWDQIDVASALTLIGELVERRDRITKSSDKLAELDALIGELEKEYEDAVGTREQLKTARGALEEHHGKLVDTQDDLSRELEDIHEAHAVVLTDDQAARLDDEFRAAAAPGNPDSLVDLDANLGRLNRRLLDAVEAAENEAARSENDLVKVFTQFMRDWEDEFPNLGVTVDSYPEYKRILDDIEAGGLADSKAEWQKALVEWSGEDLVPLATSIRAAVNDIFDRIQPINDILKALPFGARGGHLQIKVARQQPVPVQQFMGRLKRLSGTATTEMSFDDAKKRFQELSAFMGELRSSDDPRYDVDQSDRQRLLDVRRHVHISALEMPPHGASWEPREYTMLGETSGGETQELVAFIIGTALRFRLGDQLRSRPRFAPVFLDEGFVKADAMFAGRAVGAWKGLGFQIIVGTPEDKVTGLEPHMDQLLAITKDTETNLSYVHAVKDDTQPVKPPSSKSSFFEAPQ
ncbi:MAG TPA: ATP-binding protein [Nocardioidaceae bacterium]|nr:ATP-binding protein [Nocardioidaceae bacterium]